MAIGSGKMARGERRVRRDNSSQATATTTVISPVTVNLAAIRVQGNAMAPAYCDGDVVIYCRPKDGLTVRPGDDVLVLLPDPTGSLQLVLRDWRYIIRPTSATRCWPQNRPSAPPPMRLATKTILSPPAF